METMSIEIINPKAKLLLIDLAELNLIKIKKDTDEVKLRNVLANLRRNADNTISDSEISVEVETVRKIRNESYQSNF